MPKSPEQEHNTDDTIKPLADLVLEFVDMTPEEQESAQEVAEQRKSDARHDNATQHAKVVREIMKDASPEEREELQRELLEAEARKAAETFPSESEGQQ